MTARVITVLEEYRLARLKFTQKILETITRMSNLGELRAFGLLGVVKPLIQDQCHPVKNNAVMILSTCIQNDKTWIEDLLRSGVLNILLEEMKVGSATYKKSTMCILKAFISYKVEISKKIMKSPVYDILSNCLNDQDIEVREYAALVLACAARSDLSIATEIVDRGFGPHLIALLNDSKLSIKRASTAVLLELMNQSEDIANTFAVPPILEALKHNLSSVDKLLLSRTLDAFSSIAKHSEILAEKILITKIFPKSLEFFESRYPKNVKISEAVLVREIVKHNFDLARAILYFGGVGAILEAVRVETSADNFGKDDLQDLGNVCSEILNDDEANQRLAEMKSSGSLEKTSAVSIKMDGKQSVAVQTIERCKSKPRDLKSAKPNPVKKEIPQSNACPEDDRKLSEKYTVALVTSLGYISGHGNELATCVIKSGGIKILLGVLWNLPPISNVVEVCIWALGQILKSSPEKVDQTDITKYLINVLKDKDIPNEVRERCQTTLKNCVLICNDLCLLENLLTNSMEFDLDEELLADVLFQLQKILSSKASARRQFASTGCLKFVRSMTPEPGSSLFEACRLVSECFPNEIVAYFSPGYEDLLVEKFLCSDMNLLKKSASCVSMGNEERKYTSKVKMDENDVQN